MNRIGEWILDTLSASGAMYADVRIETVADEAMRVASGRVADVEKTFREGIGVRVLLGGAWGFAAASGISKESAVRAANTALSNARANSMFRKAAIRYERRAAVIGRYITEIETDPFALTADEKLKPLLEADGAMRSYKGIKASKASCEISRRDQLFLSTEGSRIEQTVFITGCGIQATAMRNGETQTRSYPNRFGRERVSAGWEYVMRADLKANGDRIARQALELVEAPNCPPGRKNIIIDGAQVALTLHETCGHAVELDRIEGMEMSLSGGSFLSGKTPGEFCFGSDAVNVTSDPTCKGGVGSYGFDSEGMPARRVEIIKNGIYVSPLMNRTEALAFGAEPTGTARAMGYMLAPMTRMANFNLEPGTWSLEDMIADLEDGLYMELCRSLSIDTQRFNFQFGPEIAWEIKNGKLGQVYKNPIFTGNSPEFWANCDAVGNSATWRMYSTDCGKGQPPQNVNVGHGTAPARFRNVQIGGR